MPCVPAHTSAIALLVLGWYLIAVLVTYCALLVLLRHDRAEVFQGVVGIIGSIFYFWSVPTVGGLLVVSDRLAAVAVIATAIAAAGAAIFCIAYRRWFVMDLE